MGWAYCGKDSKGRDIGYGIEAVCDYEGCNNKIDRGLAYKCGPMHGSGEFHCEGYFCGEHLFPYEDYHGDCYSLCPNCYKEALEFYDEEEDEV